MRRRVPASVSTRRGRAVSRDVAARRRRAVVAALVLAVADALRPLVTVELDALWKPADVRRTAGNEMGRWLADRLGGESLDVYQQFDELAARGSEFGMMRVCRAAIPKRSRGAYHPTKSRGAYHPARSRGAHHPTRSRGAYHPTRSHGAYHLTRSHGGAAAGTWIFRGDESARASGNPEC